MRLVFAIAFLLCAACPGQDAAMLAACEANQHAFELFQLFRQMTKGNFCFSPYSGHRVAAMLTEGAKGETQKELVAMAHLASAATERAARASALRQELAQAGNGLALQIANSIWAPPETPVRPDYEKLAAEQFGATAQTLPAGNGTTAAAMVNAWLREKTRGRISSMVGPNTFTNRPGTAVIVNAVYMKAAWGQPFELAQTRAAEFFLGSGSRSMLPTMRQVAPFQYNESPTWQSVEMPLGTGEVSMVFLLPRSETDREQIESKFDASAWNAVTGRSGQVDVITAIPRFGFSTQLDMQGLWQTLGARKVFEDGQADLAGISSRSLRVGQVLHEATVEVNETGAIAATVTLAPADPFGSKVEAAVEKRRRVSFIANHPFVWVIQHRRTGLILFMGRFAGE